MPWPAARVAAESPVAHLAGSATGKGEAWTSLHAARCTALHASGRGDEAGRHAEGEGGRRWSRTQQRGGGRTQQRHTRGATQRGACPSARADDADADVVGIGGGWEGCTSETGQPRPASRTACAGLWSGNAAHVVGPPRHLTHNTCNCAKQRLYRRPLQTLAASFWGGGGSLDACGWMHGCGFSRAAAATHLGGCLRQRGQGAISSCWLHPAGGRAGRWRVWGGTVRGRLLACRAGQVAGWAATRGSRAGRWQRHCAFAPSSQHNADAGCMLARGCMQQQGPARVANSFDSVAGGILNEISRGSPRSLQRRRDARECRPASGCRGGGGGEIGGRRSGTPVGRDPEGGSGGGERREAAPVRRSPSRAAPLQALQLTCGHEDKGRGRPSATFFACMGTGVVRWSRCFSLMHQQHAMRQCMHGSEDRARVPRLLMASKAGGGGGGGPCYSPQTIRNANR